MDLTVFQRIGKNNERVRKKEKGNNKKNRKGRYLQVEKGLSLLWLKWGGCKEEERLLERNSE